MTGMCVINFINFRDKKGIGDIFNRRENKKIQNLLARTISQYDPWKNIKTHMYLYTKRMKRFG
jgi:hypothetical protein